MNFDLSEDEEMLKAVAERFVTDRYDPDKRRGYLAGAKGYSADNWSLLGELGLIAAAFAEADGGLGIGAAGLATVFEALGRGLVVEPLIENAIVAGGLFASTAPDALKAEWMPELVAGTRRLALAHREQAARHNPDWVETARPAQWQRCLSVRCQIAGAGWRGRGRLSRLRAGGRRAWRC